MSCSHLTGLFCKMANDIIFFFLNIKVNNRISRTLWRGYGHDDVHLRLLHPWGNHNFLCGAQVCFSSVSLDIFKSLFYFPPTVHGWHHLQYASQHHASNSGNQISQYIWFTVQSGVSAAGHANGDHLPCPSEQWKIQQWWVGLNLTFTKCSRSLV